MKHQRIQSLLDSLDAAQRTRLERYRALLLTRALPMGFVSNNDRERLFERHILDSLRGDRCLGPGDRRVADLGSGAGLPGIPLAIADPRRSITLVEPLSKRAAFLELVVDELGLTNATVVVKRAEDLRDTFDACVARAVGDAGRAWALASPLLGPNGRLLYYAGATWTMDGQSGPAGRDLSLTICPRADFPGYGPLVIIRLADEPLV